VIRHVTADALLALAVLTVAAAALGILLMPDAYTRLHYVAPAAVVAPVLVALSVFAAEGFDSNTGATVIALVFMIAAAPFLSHATVRAMRVREHGDWRTARTDRRPPDHRPPDHRPPDNRHPDRKTR
jgi:multicomponent Na+:H+ antiporter subunit G